VSPQADSCPMQKIHEGAIFSSSVRDIYSIAAIRRMLARRLIKVESDFATCML
jgi:hypothetical protein